MYNRQNKKQLPRRPAAVEVVYSRPTEVPRVGDRKMVRGVMCVRKQAMTTHLGEKIPLISRGKPVYEWVPEKPVDKTSN